MKHNFHIQHFESLPSTNDYAKAHIQELDDREIILCDKQTNGRGRFDRVWESGNDLTFSIVFHRVAPFSLSIPIAIVQALEIGSIKAMIKWPNDILVEDKKVCGILIEKLYEGSDSIGQVVGIGVNLSTPSTLLQNKAGSIAMDRFVLLEAILDAYAILETMRTKEVLSIYRKFHYLQGRKIMLNDVLWNVEDINEDGYLVISCGAIRKILTSEEVTLQQIY